MLLNLRITSGNDLKTKLPQYSAKTMSSSLWTTEANGYLTFCVSVAFLYSVIFCFFNCDFIKKHADANNAIEKWVEKIEAANWKNHNELKKDFLSADYVGNNRYVFNIRGNNYRLVSVVVFFAGTMVIRFIGTHNDYDRIDAKNI